MENDIPLSSLEAAYSRALDAKLPSDFFTALGDYLGIITSNDKLVSFITSNLEQEHTIEGSQYWGHLHEFWWYFRRYSHELIPPAELREYGQSNVVKEWRRKDNEIAAVFANDDSNNYYFQRASYQEVLTGTHRLLIQWLKNLGQPVAPRRVSIELVMSGSHVVAKMPNGDTRLVAKLRTDLPPYVFMRHIFSNPETAIGRATVQELPGLKTKSNLSELVRQCGFSRRLKRYFFPVCTAVAIRFTPRILVTDEQVREITQLIPRSLDS